MANVRIDQVDLVGGDRSIRLAERIAARLSPGTDRDGEPVGDTDPTGRAA